MSLVTFDLDDEEEFRASTSLSSTVSRTTEDSTSTTKIPELLVDVPRHTSVLVNILKAEPRSKIDVECDVNDVLDAFLGEPSETFLDNYESIFPRYGDALYSAVDVLSAEVEHRFNVPETVVELRFLEQCDVRLRRSLPTIEVLLNTVGSCIDYRRRRTCSILLSTVHFLKKLRTRKWPQLLGSREQMLERTTEVPATVVYKLQECALLGEFRLWEEFVYEVLCMLTYPELRFSVCTRYTNILLCAEYNMLRPAVDSMDSTTLNICIWSKSYAVDIWLTYMQVYYPSIFERPDFDGDEKSREYYEAHVKTVKAPRWTRLHFYYPSVELIEPTDSDGLLVFLVDFFKRNMTPVFLSSFIVVDAPGEYEALKTEVFMTGRSRPRRECVRSAIVDKRLRK